MARNLNMLRCAITTVLWIVSCLLTVSYAAHAQQTPTANPVATQPKFNCRHPADPHRRQRECNDQAFGLDETLAGGWNEIRREAQRIGITPTGSYVGALQTNVTGGRDQVWSYAGQLSIAVDVDFSELIKTPGLSAYVGISWGTGSNLAGSLDSPILTSGLYAPTFYLGEMYLQQQAPQEEANHTCRAARGRKFICRASRFRKLRELWNQSQSIFTGRE